MVAASKPLAARQVEARSRAKTLGVRVEEIELARYYTTRSQSQPGTVYHLTRDQWGWACTCDGYRFTGCCKHLAQLERRSERERWPFGRIAPR